MAKKRKAIPATALTLKQFRKDGIEADVCERYNAHIHTTNDLFGFADIVALPGHGIVAVQCTTGPNHAARRTKILAEPRAKLWLEAGGIIWIVSWSRQLKRPGGVAFTYVERREQIALGDFDE